MNPSSDPVIDDLRPYARGDSPVPPSREALTHLLNLFDHRSEQLAAFRSARAQLLAKTQAILAKPK